MPLKIETAPDAKSDIAPKTTELADGAAAPPPKPAATPEPKKKLDTAGIEQLLKGQIGDRYDAIKAAIVEGSPTPERGPDGKFAKADPKAKDKAPEPKPKDEAAPAPPKPRTPFKPKAQPAAEPLTAEQITAAAAEGAARAVLSTKSKADAETVAKAKAEEPELSHDDKRKVAILARMEQLNPEKYKGLPTKYTKSLSALEDYAKKWETDHPGQEFDEESPEHEDFFKANDVDWNDLDFTEALADIRAEKHSQEATKRSDETLEGLKQAEKLREAQGKIVAEQNNAALKYWQVLGDDVADFVKPDGSVNSERVEALRASDPEGLEIRVRAAQALDVEVSEIYKLYNGLTKNDPANNVIHRNLNQFAASKEQELSSKPMQAKMNAEGQEFLPAARYYAMPVAERANYWTFSGSELAFLRAKELADITRKRLELNEERHRAWAKARGIQLDEPNPKPDSPGAGGESRMAALDGPAPKNAPSSHIDFLRKQIGH